MSAYLLSLMKADGVRSLATNATRQTFSRLFTEARRSYSTGVLSRPEFEVLAGHLVGVAVSYGVIGEREAIEKLRSVARSAPARKRPSKKTGKKTRRRRTKR